MIHSRRAFLKGVGAAACVAASPVVAGVEAHERRPAREETESRIAVDPYRIVSSDGKVMLNLHHGLVVVSC
jgi:hypothetical protein